MLNEIIDRYDDFEFLKADGFDEAIIGLEISSMRLIYSVTRAIELLMAQGMEREDAIEYFEFNVRGSYVGALTPIWCEDDF